MTFNVDINKLNLQQEITKASIVEAQTSTVLPQEIPIGKNESVNDNIYSKLGITQEEYFKLCSENPEFAKLSIDEQLKFIKQQNIAANKQTAAQTQTVTAGEAEVQQPTASLQPDNVAQTGSTNATVLNAPVQDAADATNTSAASSRPEDLDTLWTSFNQHDFSKLPVEEQFNVYTQELAKNKFVYSGEKTRAVAEWDALSKEEQNKYIAEAKAHLLETEGINSLKTGNKNDLKLLFSNLMTDLQSANFYNMSLDEFAKAPNAQKLERNHDYLMAIDPDLWSDANKAFIEDEALLNKAFNFAMKKADPNYQDFNYCPAELREKINEQKPPITTIELKYQYLQEQFEKDPSLLSEKEQLELKGLNNLVNTESGKKFLERLKHNSENPWDVSQDFIEEIGRSEFGKLYNKTQPGSKERAFVIKRYMESLKDDPEKLKMAYDHYIFSLTADEAEEASYVASYVISEFDSEDFKNLLNGKNVNGQRILRTKAGEMNKEQLTEVAQKDKALEEVNPALAEEFQLTGLEVLDPDKEVSTVYTEMTSGAKSQKVQEKTVDFRNNVKDSKIFDKIDNQIKENSSIETRSKAIKTLKNTKVDDETRLRSYNRQLEDGHPELVKAAAGVVAETFGKETEQAAGEVVFEASKKLDKKDAIETQTILADQIELCDASNQAAMHKMISQSQYEEVIQHAAENIYKYDESAQKDAMKYTFETGNQKAIETAISNVDKCEGLANETASIPSNSQSYDSQLSNDIKSYTAKIEQKYTQQVAEEYADYTVEQDLRTGLISDEEQVKSAKEAYIEKFKDPSTNKFALLGQLEPSQRKEALKVLVKYAPTMINAFIDLGYGPQILKIIGETSDLAVKVVELMDFKGQPAAKAIVQRYPEHYEELYIKYFAKDKNDTTANNYFTVPTPSYNLMQQANRQGKIFLKG